MKQWCIFNLEGGQLLLKSIPDREVTNNGKKHQGGNEGNRVIFKVVVDRNDCYFNGYFNDRPGTRGIPREKVSTIDTVQNKCSTQLHHLLLLGRDFWSGAKSFFKLVDVESWRKNECMPCASELLKIYQL